MAARHSVMISDDLLWQRDEKQVFELLRCLSFELQTQSTLPGSATAAACLRLPLLPCALPSISLRFAKFASGCPRGRYWRGTGLLCGCSFASNYGWIREVWVGGDGMGASRPGAVTPRLARTSAETPGRSARVGLLGLQCSAGALLRGSSELANK
jgi:hypothetical protein